MSSFRAWLFLVFVAACASTSTSTSTSTSADAGGDDGDGGGDATGDAAHDGAGDAARETAAPCVPVPPDTDAGCPATWISARSYCNQPCSNVGFTCYYNCNGDSPPTPAELLCQGSDAGTAVWRCLQ